MSNPPPRSRIYQLSEIAHEGLHFSTRYALQTWDRSAQALVRESEEHTRRERYDEAFILMARAAVLWLEKIPSHPEYQTIPSLLIRSFKLQGEQALHQLTLIKSHLILRPTQPVHVPHQLPPAVNRPIPADSTRSGPLALESSVSRASTVPVLTIRKDDLVTPAWKDYWTGEGGQKKKEEMERTDRELALFLSKEEEGWGERGSVYADSSSHPSLNSHSLPHSRQSPPRPPSQPPQPYPHPRHNHQPPILHASYRPSPIPMPDPSHYVRLNRTGRPTDLPPSSIQQAQTSQTHRPGPILNLSIGTQSSPPSTTTSSSLKKCPASADRTPLRPVIVPARLISTFLNVARECTERGVEMCGLLLGVVRPVGGDRVGPVYAPVATRLNRTRSVLHQFDDNDNGFYNHNHTAIEGEGEGGRERLFPRELIVKALLIPRQEGTGDTCQMIGEEEVVGVQLSKGYLTLGWIHTHPTQSCFMSSMDLHTHSAYQQTLPEAIAIVCAPRKDPSFGIFRLTEPGGLGVILGCKRSRLFHEHPTVRGGIYTDADQRGHVRLIDRAPIEVIDLR